MTPPLSSLPPNQDVLWLLALRQAIGTREIAGPKHNPLILEMHATTRLAAKSDETAWCSSAVNWAVTKAGLKGTDSAAAISWLRWGVSLGKPAVGAIVVLTRAPKPDGAPQFHVGMVDRVSDDGARIWVLGGNQQNAVTVARRSVGDVVMPGGYRWPVGQPLPPGVKALP